MTKGLFIIVASGQSAKGFVPPPDVKVISVNGSIDWLSRADYWFTLDPSKVNKSRMLNQRKGTKYYCAFNENLNIPNINYLERVESPKLHYLGKFAGVSGLQKDPGKISTGNSAYGALNLAYHLGAKKILLVGVDGTSARIEGGRSRDLTHLDLLFSTALRDLENAGIKVMNASPESKIRCFKRCSIEQGLEWLK